MSSWNTLPPDIRHIAQQVLTPKQLTTYKLDANGMSEADMAILLHVSRRAVRDRLAEADIKIRRHPDYPKEAA